MTKKVSAVIVSEVKLLWHVMVEVYVRSRTRSIFFEYFENRVKNGNWAVFSGTIMNIACYHLAGKYSNVRHQWNILQNLCIVGLPQYLRE